VTPHDTPALTAMMLGHGVEVPKSIGLFGVAPDLAAANFRRLSTDRVERVIQGRLQPRRTDRAGVRGLGPKPGVLQMRAGHVNRITAFRAEAVR